MVYVYGIMWSLILFFSLLLNSWCYMQTVILLRLAGDMGELDWVFAVYLLEFHLVLMWELRSPYVMAILWEISRYRYRCLKSIGASIPMLEFYRFLKPSHLKANFFKLNNRRRHCTKYFSMTEVAMRGLRKYDDF